MSASLIPVLIAGGAGTRLWPASRQARPKPFQKFGLPHTLLQETALRFKAEPFTAPMVICSTRHADLAAQQLREVGIEPLAVIAEPEARNTGPAVAAAAAAAAHWPGRLMLLVHADNLVGDPAALREEVLAGIPAAEAGNIVIFGVKPTGPSTDYGYIEAGEPDLGAFKVSRFVEKPPLEEARRMAADPRYTWNAGLFLIDPPRFMDEARRLAPELAEAASAAVAEARRDGPILTLGPSFSRAPSIAVDYAILEKTSLARVRTGDFGWGDAGTWKAIWQGGPHDERGNLTIGDVTLVESKGVLALGEGASVVAIGVEDLAVIVQDGVVLVTRRELADQAHKLMDFARRPDLK